MDPNRPQVSAMQLRPKLGDQLQQWAIVRLTVFEIYTFSESAKNGLSHELYIIEI